MIIEFLLQIILKGKLKNFSKQNYLKLIFLLSSVEIDTEQNSKDEVLYSVGAFDNYHKSNTMLRTRLRFIGVVGSTFFNDKFCQVTL